MAFLHRFHELVTVFDDAGLDHLAEKVVALPGTLPHSSEDRETVVLLGDVVDQLLDQHGLTHTGSTEKTDLSALQIRLQKVDDLDAGVKHLLRGLQVLEFRRLPMNRQGVVLAQVSQSVDRVPDNIHHTAPDLSAGRHRDRSVRVDRLHPSPQTVGGVHRHASDRVLADVLLHLDDQGLPALASVHIQRIMDAGKLRLIRLHIEMDIHHRPDDLRNVPYVLIFCHL